VLRLRHASKNAVLQMRYLLSNVRNNHDVKMDGCRGFYHLAWPSASINLADCVTIQLWGDSAPV